MAQSILDIIIKTKKEGNAPKEIADGLKDVKQGLAGAIEGFTGLSLSSLGVAGAIAGVGGALKNTIDSTLKYADEVRDLTRISGASAEESSRLIQVADDLQVSYETLAQAAKAAAKNGIALTTTELVKLQQEYQKIQDPAERAKFAMEKFGKAGVEMQKILEMDAKAFQDMADSVEGSMILTEKQVQAAKDLEVGLDNLQDKVAGVGYAVGNWLVSGLNEALTALNLLINQGAIVNNVMEKHSKEVAIVTNTYEEYVKEMVRANLAAGGYKITEEDLNKLMGSSSDVIEGLTQRFKFQTQAQWEATRQQNQYNILAKEAIIEIDREKGAYMDLGSAGKDWNKILENLRVTNKDVIEAMKPLTLEMIYQKVAAQMDGEAAAELGRKWGLIDESSYAVIKGLKKIKDQFDADRDGIINAKEATEDFYDSLDRLVGRKWTVNLMYQVTKIGDPANDPINPNPYPQEPGWGTPPAPSTDPGGVTPMAVANGTAAATVINIANANMSSAADVEALAMRITEIQRRRRA